MEIGSLADWFGAVGTIAAVIVALWQSLRREKPSLTFQFYRNENFMDSDNCKLYTLHIVNNSSQMVVLTYTNSKCDSYTKTLWPLGTTGDPQIDNKWVLGKSNVWNFDELNIKKEGKIHKIMFNDQISGKKYKVTYKYEDIPIVISYK